ncbi:MULTISPECIES: Gfo/Idh/MocA family oxidoreductase [unclassified Salinibacterium]|uniref:Gfo/Idh/MocA family protein n=1 Tax=unclassified Salinibacterium TaxID=2632331 RepID=UPI0014221E66|nr:MULTISPECIES: Gfo/Idh/MocA family oxidoreductase [unclassified Salinibacterium]
MTAPTRVALVGAGHVSQYHLRAWADLQGAQVVAVIDPDQARAADRVREFGVGWAFSTIDEALDTVAVDVLDIATTPSTHAELLQQAFDRNLDAICQKPLCADFDEAVAVARRARDATSLVMVNDNWRYRSWYRRLKGIADRGELGRIFHVASSARFAGTIRSSAHPDVPFSLARQPYFAELDRFLLLESAIHQIDALRSVLGTPTTVHARGHSIAPGIAGEDVVTLMLGYEAATAVIDRSYASHSIQSAPVLSEQVRVEGTGGTATIDQNGDLTVVRDAPSGRQIETFPAEPRAYEQSYATAFQHFLDARNGRVPLESTINDALGTLAVVFAAYESMTSDEVVRLADFATRHGWEEQ